MSVVDEEQAHDLALPHRAAPGQIGVDAGHGAPTAAGYPMMSEVLRRLYAIEYRRRVQIARDLHDFVGQQTATLLLSCHRLSRVVRSSRARDDLARLRQQVDGLSDALRRITASVQPRSRGGFDLAAAIAMHVEVWREGRAIDVALRTPGLERLSEDAGETLFATVVEALTNTAKHADGATGIAIAITATPAVVTIAIEDNGNDTGGGLEAGALLSSGRYGLVGLRERFAERGGHLHWERSRSAGFTVSGWLPIPGGRP